MTFAFSPEMILILNQKLDSAESSNNYKEVYEYIFDQITDQELIPGDIPRIEYHPKEGVEKSVWLWVRGALGVNTDDQSYFSNYIRNWTATEYELRYGEPQPHTGDKSMQDASNEIARTFTADIVRNGFLPDIRTTGLSDAGSVASKFFGGNYSSWAGTILSGLMKQKTALKKPMRGLIIPILRRREFSFEIE